MSRTTFLAISCAAALAVSTAAVGSASGAVRPLDGEQVSPFQPVGVTAVPQGIKAADVNGSYYIVGTADQTTGAVYDGPIDQGATGTWTYMDVPDSWATSDSPLTTSIYGVDNLSGESVALVGTWAEGDLLGEGNASFYYEGPVTADPDATDFQAFRAQNRQGDVAQFTFLHSVSGDLAVGNWDMAGNKNPEGHAFIFNPDNGRQIAIKYPKNQRSYTHTAYGIWWNGGNKYTIAGGASRNKGWKSGRIGEPIGDGTLIDYNSKTGRFSNFTRFSFPARANGKAPITHFEGIWSNGNGKYRMPATATTKNGAKGAVATVKRTSNGWSAPKWRTIAIEGSELLTTNNSIYKKASVGITQVGGEIQSYAFLAD